MNRILIINQFIKKNNYTSYLEIGVQGGHCFNNIECASKIGVDPSPTATCNGELLHITSDAFFASNKKKFGCIFIDGLHMQGQVKRDLLNAIYALEENGTIVVHDCSPLTELMQTVPLTSQVEWTGDVWKAWVEFRMNGFKQYVVDCDYGVGVIAKDKVAPFVCIEELTWDNLVKNRKEWLNLISIEEFNVLSNK